MTTLNTAIELLKEIASLGYEAYIVGGTARDMIMGVPSNDIDIATNCPIEVLQKKFDTYEIGRGKEFGVLLIRYKNESYEVAQFRTESDYDGARPGKVEITTSLRNDVTRRDFTINAIALDADGNFIDHVGGTADIVSRVVRAVGNPSERFQEDHVRMMRAARFATMDGFVIETKTRRSIRRMYKLINCVTAERIGLEIYKAASKSGDQFAKFICILDDLKILGQILPEVITMKYFRQDLRHHPEGPTVFEHTIKCLEVMKDSPPIAKIAALLHDIGKCLAFNEEKYSWKLSYPGHASIGADMAVDAMRRMKFSEWNTEAVEYAVRNHMKFHDINKMRASKIARMVNNPHFPILEEVARADEYSRGEAFAYYGDFENKIDRARAIKEKWENRLVNHEIKLVDGKKIMELLNIPPSKEVGRIKQSVEEHIIDNDLEPTDELITELIYKYKEI